jgi:hypothetical protein
MVCRELEGLFVKLKNTRFGPLLFIGVMVIRGILFKNLDENQ